MIRLDRLLLRKLGNIAPDTELHFGKRGALLLGKNGTGKTTLLNVIVAVLKSDWIALHEMSKGSYDIAFDLTMSDGEMPDIRLTVEVKRAPQENARSLDRIPRLFGTLPSLFTAIIGLPGGDISISCQQGETTWKHGKNGDTEKQIIQSVAETLYFASNLDMDMDNRERINRHLEEFISISHRLYRFDEALTYYDILTLDEEPREFLRLNSKFEPSPNVVASATAETLAASLRRLGEHLRPRHSTLDVSIDCSPEKDSGTANDVSLVIRDGVTTDAAERSADRVSLDWLNDFCKMNFLDGARIQSTKSESGADYSVFGPLRFELQRGSQIFFGNHLLSFGQKRLLSFLHYQKANPSILVADELVNGMHHEWIQHCTDKMLQQQAFLSSQNPLLFDFMSFESAEDAAQRFVACSLDDQGRFVWRNLTPEDAAEFFQAYQTGIQHVSEILRTRGYW
jgi:hypothetical protein